MPKNTTKGPIVPTYEYVCTQCGEPLEIVQSIHEPSLTVCPKCDGKLRKVFGNVGVVFKGSGFYKTDSRSAEAKRKKAATSDSKSDSGSGESKKPTESKSTTEGKTPAKEGSASSTSSGSTSSGSTSSGSTTSKPSDSGGRQSGASGPKSAKPS
ncbi:MAG: FmdB family zinc ribbon protein [Actinomycetes bacterium]